MYYHARLFLCDFWALTWVFMLVKQTLEYGAPCLLSSFSLILSSSSAEMALSGLLAPAKHKSFSGGGKSFMVSGFFFPHVVSLLEHFLIRGSDSLKTFLHDRV